MFNLFGTRKRNALPEGEATEKRSEEGHFLFEPLERNITVILGGLQGGKKPDLYLFFGEKVFCYRQKKNLPRQVLGWGKKRAFRTNTEGV